MTLDDGPFSSAAAALDSTVPVVYSYTGKSGDVSTVPKSVIDYYLNIEQVLSEEKFENEADRALLEDKVLEQLECDGLMKLLGHWDGSRVAERVLVKCCQETLIRFSKLLEPHLTEAATDKFASHVLELLVMRLCKEFVTNFSLELERVTNEVLRRMCINSHALSQDYYGSRVIQTTLQALSGMKVEDGRSSTKRWEIGKHSLHETARPCPKLGRIVNKFCRRILKEDVQMKIYNEQGAPVIVILLAVLHRCGNEKALAKLKTTIMDSFSDKVTDYKMFEKYGALPKLLLDSKSSFVVQSLIKVCSKPELEALYTSHFKDLIVPLSLHPVANYTVQTLLDHAPSRDLADQMCGQLVLLLEDLLAESFTGVLVSVLKCCHHHALSSYNIMGLLKEAFHVPDDQTNLLFRCIMSLTTHEVLLEKMESYKKPTQSGKPRRDRFEATLAGSLLLQGIFRLGFTEFLEEGVCRLSEDHIVYLSTKTESSYAVQALMASLLVPSPVKRRFIKAAVCTVDKLVISPSGSHIVEDMWKAADTELKSAIAQVLLSKEQGIKDNTYGRIVWKNCNIEAFKLGSDHWEKTEQKKQKTVQSFREIIENKTEEKVSEKSDKRKRKENSDVNVVKTKKKKAKD